ncbi:MAG: DMT family transporter [Candidatus Dadabacteria bacterium]|nr:DMT family transporter [Candidatus Dadabacteria bacterium]
MINKSIAAHFPMTSNSKGILLMVLGGFAFATMGALTHELGKHCDWLLIAFFRMLISFIITFGLALRAGINPFVFNNSTLWLRSLVGSSAMLATFYALTQLPISEVAVITETRPIWVAILAGYILGETSSKKIWLSIIFGMIGVILVEHPRILEQNFAGLLAVYAAFGGAVVMICLRKLKNLDPRVIVTHFSGIATIITLITLFSVRGEVDLSVFDSTTIILMLLGVGVFGTIGQLAMTKAFSIGEAPSVASAGFIKVGFSAGYDLLIWNYIFNIPTIIGMILILASTGWLFSRKKNSTIESQNLDHDLKNKGLIIEK